MKRNKPTIVRYRTANQCLAAYHGCRVSELPSRGYWYFFDRKGKRVRLSVKACHKEIVRRGCWGFCRDKSSIHVWISSRATTKEAVALLAHELGHCQKPWLSRGREEIKAAGYERVAETAIAALLDMRRKWFRT